MFQDPARGGQNGKQETMTCATVPFFALSVRLARHFTMLGSATGTKHKPSRCLSGSRFALCMDFTCRVGFVDAWPSFERGCGCGSARRVFKSAEVRIHLCVAIFRYILITWMALSGHRCVCVNHGDRSLLWETRRPSPSSQKPIVAYMCWEFGNHFFSTATVGLWRCTTNRETGKWRTFVYVSLLSRGSSPRRTPTAFSFSRFSVGGSSNCTV